MVAAIASGSTGSKESHVAIARAGLAGVISILLGVVGAIVDEMQTFPGTGATAGQIAHFVAVRRPELLVSMVLNTTAVGLWLLFGAGVWLVLRARGGGESLLSACFLVGLVGFVVLLLAGFTCFDLLVYRSGEVSDPKLLYDLGFGLLAMSGVPTALALGSYAASVLAEGGLPRWSAWIAIFAALSHLLLLASLVISSGFFSLAGGVTIAIPGTLFAWILGTGIVLMRASGALVGSRTESA